MQGLSPDLLSQNLQGEGKNQLTFFFFFFKFCKYLQVTQLGDHFFHGLSEKFQHKHSFKYTELALTAAIDPLCRLQAGTLTGTDHTGDKTWPAEPRMDFSPLSLLGWEFLCS